VTKNVNITYLLAGGKMVPLCWESDSGVRNSGTTERNESMSARMKWKSVRENNTLKIIKNKLNANQNVIAKNSIRSDGKARLNA